MGDRLKKRKPILAGTGLLEIGNAGANSSSDNSAIAGILQASRIQKRFAVSWPVARAVAELAFAEARQ